MTRTASPVTLARTLVVAAVLVGSVAACQDGSELAETSSRPAGSGQEAGTTSPGGPESGPLLPGGQPVGDVFNHLNGTQARVEAIAVKDAGVTVLLGISNGHDEAVTLSEPGDTYLLDGAGARYPLAAQRDVTVPAYGDADITYDFLGTPPADAELTLMINDGGGASESNQFSSSPAFRLGPYDLGAARDPQPTPARRALGLGKVHPNGVELRLGELAFGPTRIAVSFEVTNGRKEAVTLNTPGDGPVVDDLDNQYRLAPPAEDAELRVASGGTLRGTLVFVGRVDPRATSLTIRLNEGGGSSESNQFSTSPAFAFEGVPLVAPAGQAAPPLLGALPADIGIDEQQQHENGSQAELGTISFSPDGMTASMVFRNGGRDAITLNGPGDGFVVDDLGNEYRLQDPPGNKELVVPPGAGLEAVLSYAGRIDRNARRVTLKVNDGGGASLTNQFTDNPGFSFGPYSLDLASRPAPAAATDLVAVLGARSTLGEGGQVASSSAQAVALILSKYNGIEIPEGVLYTVPENVLFDFDSSELRPDAAQALAGIATVAGFYGGAPVRIVGHTDAVGDDAYNLDLSRRRATSVLDALVASHGVDRGRLSSDGQGEARPVAPNAAPGGGDDPAGRQRNRRVEVVVTTDRGLPK